jgi:phospholipid-translocating ATPase
VPPFPCQSCGFANQDQRILDTHNKSIIVIVSFLITIAGWWAWQGLLNVIYSHDVTPYAVRNGFASVFGPDPSWWVTLVLVLAALITTECAYRSVKRTLVVMGLWKWGWKWLSGRTWKKAFGGWWRGNADTVWGGEGLERSVEEWGVEMWQEMEKDEGVREMLRRINAGDEAGDEQDGREEEVGDGKVVDSEGSSRTGGLFVS